MPTRISFSNGNFLDYFYNAEGARIEKAFTVGGNTTRTEYEFGTGGNLIAIYENNATLPTHYYNEVGYIRREDSVRFYYLKDQLGNNRVAFSDSVGITLTERNDFFAYGAPRESWIRSGDERWKFLGKEHDEETQTEHLEARELDGFAGLFWKIDELAELYPEFSPYSYSFSNPYHYADPSGLSPDTLEVVAYQETETAYEPTVSEITLVEGFQFGLDMVGTFAPPGWGVAELADLLNAGIYYAQGDALNGTISLAGLTVVGDLAKAGRAAKVVKKLIPKKPKSINQLIQMALKGQVPKGIKRFDAGKGSVNLPKDEVHFNDGASLYRDGNWRHNKVNHKLTKDQKEFLSENGWTIPNE